MTLFDVFDWLELTAIGEAVRGSIWLFPAIEAVHLLALAMIGGAVLVVDLRLLGASLRDQPVASVAKNAHPWLVASLLALIATGVPLFLSEAVKCYFNTSFWVKMITLVVAVTFAFSVRRRIADGRWQVGAGLQKLTGATSIGLWFVVAAAGRWIGFS
ncbi:MAG: hypothetical protein OES38_14865 [Gammaproteobacteria bacterium]|nr:hypothetical protein [Gammaproteobacteria bacterium]